jgi:hypothetical protein
VKAIITLLIVLFFQSSLSAQEEEKFLRHSLVDIFCTALIERSSNENNSKNLDEIWPILENHFQSGKLYSSLLSNDQLESSLETLKSTPLFKKCVDENRKDLDYGEFILTGKKIIEDTLLAYQKVSSPSLSSASFQLSEGGGLLSGLSLNISGGESNFESPRIIEVINQREKKYQTMWHRFIADLKSKSKSLHF